MGASVISFRSVLGRGRSNGSVPGPWTNQELAELYRIADLLGRAGMAVGTESGVTDENEPWFVFFALETSDVIAHFARIGGAYIAVAAGQERPLRGTCFRDLVQKIMDCEPLVLPQPRKRSGKVTNLYLHPMVVLAAFVATALLWSNKAMAVPEGEADTGARRGGRPGDATATGGALGSGGPGGGHASAEAGLPGGPNFLTAMTGQSTAVTFASAAALISTVLKAEEAAAEEDVLRLGASEGRLHGLDGGLTATGSDIGHRTVAQPASIEMLAGEVRVTVGAADGKAAFLLSSAGHIAGPAPFAAVPAAAMVFDPADQFSLGAAPAIIGRDTDGPSVSAMPVAASPAHSVAVVAEPAASISVGGAGAVRPPTTGLAAAPGDSVDGGRIMIDLRLDDVLLANRKGLYTQISFVMPGEVQVDIVPSAVGGEAVPTEGRGGADTDGAPGASATVTSVVLPPPPMTVDNRHDVVLGAGQQVIYFSGGSATVTGFVAGEDVLLVDPRLLTDRWQACVPVEHGTAVLSFADGSQLVLHDLVLSAYVTGG